MIQHNPEFPLPNFRKFHDIWENRDFILFIYEIFKIPKGQNDPPLLLLLLKCLVNHSVSED